MRLLSSKSTGVLAFATVAWVAACSYDFHQFAAPGASGGSGMAAGGGPTAVGSGGNGTAGGSEASTTTGAGGGETEGAGGAPTAGSGGGSSAGGDTGSAGASGAAGSTSSGSGGGGGSPGGSDAGVDSNQTGDAFNEATIGREGSGGGPNPDASTDVAMPGSDASVPIDSGCGTACTQCVDSADCSCAAYNGHEYRFCTTALSFANSKIQCAIAGMRLARVDTLLENAWLRSTGDAKAMGEQWIGIEDPNKTLNWQWTDGQVFWTGSSTGSAVGGLYSNWNPNNPSGNSVRNCASMQGVSSGTWLDRSCTSLLPYVCELY